MLSDTELLDWLLDRTVRYSKQAGFSVEFIVPVFAFLVQSKHPEDLDRYLKAFRPIIDSLSEEQLKSLTDIQCLKSIVIGYCK